jgi:hypothetical protein
MNNDVASALNAFRAYTEPRDGLGSNPFKLACTFDDPASTAEIETAWPGREVPGELVQMWSTSRQTRLFEDVDYGQWGLLLLSPAASAQRTLSERELRPRDYHTDDMVIGEFLGDQELVVFASSETVRDHVLVADPIYHRANWAVAAGSLAEFLKKFLAALGEKYWEPANQ